MHTEAPKARSDFNVSGNDVVIALLDTGIDTGHTTLQNQVIHWYDPFSGTSTASDTNGHGTTMAGIICGNSSYYKGYAPGAKLVGIKTGNDDNNMSRAAIRQGLQWVLSNYNTYGIDMVCLAASLYSSDSELSSIISLINQLNNMGVHVFVSVGNRGPSYGSMSLIAQGTDLSVADVMDARPYGWGIYSGSSRGPSSGTLSTWPRFSASGFDVEAPVAGTTGTFTLKTGSSMSTAAVAGTFALCIEAARRAGNRSATLSPIDMGPDGTDAVYGIGRVSTYTSVKRSAGQGNNSSYTFSDGYTKGVLSGSLSAGEFYYVDVYIPSGTSATLNATLINVNTNSGVAYLIHADPKSNGVADMYFYYQSQTSEFFSPTPGWHSIGVYCERGQINYSVDITGKFSV